MNGQKTRWTRRDFLNGVAVTVGASLTSGCARCSGSQNDQGVLGSRSEGRFAAGEADSFSAAHALRDGGRFPLTTLPIEGEVDLLVVGAGISGLTAAYEYRKRVPNARVLLLDNQDDFGGHARRCEMRVDGKLILGYGGSESLQSPNSLWSKGALTLLAELGVEVRRFEGYFARDFYPKLGLSRGILFKRESFGEDKLVTGDPSRMVADDLTREALRARSWPAFIADFPLSARSREQLLALHTEPRDVLAGLTTEQKQRALATQSYRDFLTQRWGLDEAAANVFQKRSHDFFALGIDAIAASDARATGYPGFQGLNLPVDEEAQAELEEPYIYHFPDGNASLARLLVRKLVPGIAEGSTMEDIVLARFKRERLDASVSEVRLRLESTVVSLQQTSDGHLDVGYVHKQRLRRVRAQHVIYAGFNMMLPLVYPSLPPSQASILRQNVKAPLVYVKVALRQFRSWVKVGVHEVTNPMGFYSRIKLDYPVSMGGYAFARSPNDPIGLHLVHVPAPWPPAAKDLDARTIFRLGRQSLLSTPFSEFERQAVDELTRILEPGGFAAERDIAEIQVFRWGHGYAYGLSSLHDPRADEAFPERAHRRAGALTIANSDAAFSAYAHSAIDEAARAVRELTQDN